MRAAQIQAKMRRHWQVTTRRDPLATIMPNYLNQNFHAEAPNQVWVSDITSIPTREGWLYLAIVLDLFSRKAVGLRMGITLESALVVRALQQALHRRQVSGELMHHSDRGCQYTSREFSQLAERHGITLSMSGVGHCYDNAVAESFFHTLKTEHINLSDFDSRSEAEVSIFDYVEVFYNRKRLHSTIGYLSPQEHEEAWENKIAMGVA